jgi:hypothetical protein
MAFSTLKLNVNFGQSTSEQEPDSNLTYRDRRPGTLRNKHVINPSHPTESSSLSRTFSAYYYFNSTHLLLPDTTPNEQASAMWTQVDDNERVKKYKHEHLKRDENCDRKFLFFLLTQPMTKNLF